MAKLMDQQIAGAGVAKIMNVGLAMSAMKQIQSATSQMPRIAVLSGPPGYGKSQAALFMAHPLGTNASFIQLRMFDTVKSIAEMLLTELDVRFQPSWNTARKFDAICERLNQNQRPLVIDEFDHIAEKSSVDFIRAIHDQCSTPIFLIGEESLQRKLLTKHERFHDRVLTWAHAVPCDEDDASHLAKHYAPNLKWADGAMAGLVRRTAGVARRITTEVERLNEECKRKGVDTVHVQMLAREGAR